MFLLIEQFPKQAEQVCCSANVSVFCLTIFIQTDFTRQAVERATTIGFLALTFQISFP